MPPMPLDRKVQIPVGHRNSILVLDPVLGVVGTDPAKGDTDAARDRNSDKQRSGTGKDGGSNTPVCGRREEYIIGDPPDHIRDNDCHGRIKGGTGAAKNKLPWSTANLASDEAETLAKHHLVGDGAGLWVKCHAETRLKSPCWLSQLQFSSLPPMRHVRDNGKSRASFHSQ